MLIPIPLFTLRDDSDMPIVKIEATEIADNKATISAMVESGSFYGAKIVTGVRVSTLTLDYTREIPLIKYVEANGTAAELPFTTQLTDLIFEQDYFCAVIVYDRTGRACHSAYLTFTAEGDPNTGIVIGDVDHARIADTRASLPALKHRVM